MVFKTSCRKLSKYETLQMALSYIEELGRILQEKPIQEGSDDNNDSSDEQKEVGDDSEQTYQETSSDELDNFR